jgi:FKBP-type peptidyl-prolyl cis-trans isomerase FkpA
VHEEIMPARGLLLLLALSAASIGPASAADSVLELIASPDQLQTIDQTVGTGPVVRRGAWVVLHYTGWIFDPTAPDGRGAKFDSSRDRGESLSFLYGYKRALPGLENGLEGMRVGGRRTILVPPKFGYDGIKYPLPKDVPPRSTLVFEVDLNDVVAQSAPPDD